MVFVKPQPLPILIGAANNRKASAHVHVFEHPYHAITDKCGAFTIARVPAGAEVSVMAWHESVGWVLTSKGKTIAIEKDKKHTLDFKLKAPAPGN